MIQPYPRYRDSGVEWLGEVPQHWAVVPLKSMIQTFVGGSWGSEAGEDDEDAQCIRATDFDYRRLVANLDSAPVRSFPRRDVLRRGLERGELVMATSAGSTDRAVGAVVVFDSDQPALPTNFAAKMVPRDDVDTWYLAYLHNALNTLGVTRSLTNQVTIANLDTPAYLASHGPLPPLDEQRAIAAYLDRETERIDALVAKKRLLIERLEEYRSALITRTVTRGLPPEAARAAGLDRSPRLKPSGVEWLGDVPEHWEVGNIRRYAEMKSGHTPSRQHPEYWEDCDTPWFTLSDVWQLRDGRATYLDETRELISEVGIANSAAELLPSGTVILSRTASIGFSGVMPVPMATSQDFWNWVCGPKLIPNYLLLTFRSMQSEFSRLMMGSTHRTIYEASAASFRIPVPPTPEQQAIIEFLEERLPSNDAARDAATLAIERLQEYRTALIKAAVTGKIDVRE